MNESYIGDLESLGTCRSCQFLDKVRRKETCGSLKVKTGETIKLVIIYFVCILLKEMQGSNLSKNDFKRLVNNARNIVSKAGERCPKYFEFNSFVDSYGSLQR